MDGLDVKGYISSQRAKLEEEKFRLNNNQRKVRGILPSDSIVLEKNNRLRRERQSEYQEFIKNNQLQKIKPPSIAEIRRNLSQEREREIIFNMNELDLERQNSASQKQDYSSLRAKKLEEEKRYANSWETQHQLYDEHRSKQWDQSYHPKPKYSNVIDNKELAGTHHSNWDEDETDLMQWTQGQTRKQKLRNPNRSQTPPTYDSPGKILEDSSKTTLRSISAPHITPGVTIAGIGAGEEDSNVKRMKQLKYGEELLSQIKAKQKTSKHRRAAWLKVDNHSKDRPRDSGEQNEKQSQYNRDGGGKLGFRPPRKHHPDSENFPISQHYYDGRYNDSKIQPMHLPHSISDEDLRDQNYRRDDKVSRKHPPFRQTQANYQDRSGYYDDSYPPPPPPPPQFQGYNPPPGVPWRSPYYSYGHYPMEFEPDSYGRRYYPHYRGPPPPQVVNNPYVPPFHGHHPPPFSLKPWENRDVYPKHSLDRNNEEVRKSPSSSRHQSNGEMKLSPLNGIGSDMAKSDKLAYREQLDKQVEEKKQRELKEKFAKENYDKKRDSEIYDPFGKGGCGAPVRDQHGNLIADLKQMRKINEARLSNSSPRFSYVLKENTAGNEIQQSHPVSPQATVPIATVPILTYEKKDEENAKKMAKEKYKEDLQQQMKEKELIKQKEKELQKIEEEKALEQLERDRKRLHEEYLKELEQQRMKEEEARQKNEAIKREAEMKRQIAIMKQKQEVLKEEAERRSLANKRLSDKISEGLNHSYERTLSPPVPALRHKMKQNPNLALAKTTPTVPKITVPTPTVPTITTDVVEQNSFRSSSPPVPALRKRLSKNLETHNSSEHQPVAEAVARNSLHEAVKESSSGSEQSELLLQLGAIRMHLQAELARQGSLPRHLDIFERAKQQKPKIVAPEVTRTGDNTTAAIREFNKLKYNNSTQRREFIEAFPDTPDSESTLELQQTALLRHQSELNRRAARNNSLTSDTVYISLGAKNPFHDALSGNNHEPVQRPQGFRKTQEKHVSSPSLDSLSTLEMDNMAARNEERRKRLDTILNGGTKSDHQNCTVPLRDTLFTRQSEKSLDCDTQHLPIN